MFCSLTKARRLYTGRISAALWLPAKVIQDTAAGRSGGEDGGKTVRRD